MLRSWPPVSWDLVLMAEACGFQEWNHPWKRVAFLWAILLIVNILALSHWCKLFKWARKKIRASVLNL